MVVMKLSKKLKKRLNGNNKFKLKTVEFISCNKNLDMYWECVETTQVINIGEGKQIFIDCKPTNEEKIGVGFSFTRKKKEIICSTLKTVK